MKITLDNPDSDYRIQSYEEGAIRINDKKIDFPVIVNRSGIYAWEVKAASDLNKSHFQDIFKHKPEIFILGTGATQIFPSTDIVILFSKNRVAFEVMDTGAACRTYNILLSEGRDVSTGLFMQEITETNIRQQDLP